jgi:uncharacterized protein YndB with AHSA1/START domain
MIAIAVVVLAVAVLVYAATRPDTFRIERSTVIQAPPEKVFILIDDLHAWDAWSPWEKQDPALKRTYSGAARGRGAAYAWDGNRNVGSGRMEISESIPPSKVAIKLDFIAPFKARNIAEFDLIPQDGGTKVTWAMSGPNSFVSKLLHLFIDMDKMIGNNFDAGLAAMKAAAEKSAPATP